MRRNFIYVVVGLAMLLCAATCARWARSYWVSDRVGWITERPTPGGTTSRELTYWNVIAYGGMLQVQSEVRVRGAPEYIAFDRADLEAGLYKADGVALGYSQKTGGNLRTIRGSSPCDGEDRLWSFWRRSGFG